MLALGCSGGKVISVATRIPFQSCGRLSVRRAEGPGALHGEVRDDLYPSRLPEFTPELRITTREEDSRYAYDKPSQI